MSEGSQNLERYQSVNDVELKELGKTREEFDRTRLEILGRLRRAKEVRADLQAEARQAQQKAGQYDHEKTNPTRYRAGGTDRSVKPGRMLKNGKNYSEMQTRVQKKHVEETNTRRETEMYRGEGQNARK